MNTIVKIRPEHAGLPGAHIYEVSQRSGNTVRTLTTIARNGRVAVDNFRHAYGQMSAMAAKQVAA